MNYTYKEDLIPNPHERVYILQNTPPGLGEWIITEDNGIFTAGVSSQGSIGAATAKGKEFYQRDNLEDAKRLLEEAYEKSKECWIGNGYISKNNKFV